MHTVRTRDPERRRSQVLIEQAPQVTCSDAHAVGKLL
jgi:hypothetical protein